ncbi:hypothetical protein FA15DRAFT_579640 [Coprinopsis marcescibilis]|uniref:Inner centromere protein ARK-binding domain-containing protein n=1 Tax=Coprinopsis marcescibilis TaxID=230819 RepID=A0A5C3LCT2_COPMA|nr:hypothetical protein FA15DRAFT_579640 [Coprinopsis marcescibilis]
MLDTPLPQHGLLQWANSIRLNMATDSGRETFQQQVQSHGFLFLDDYLDNILAGAKQDPLIELVKTPGRRKVISKKPKLASKLGNPISFSLLGPAHDDPDEEQPTESLSNGDTTRLAAANLDILEAPPNNRQADGSRHTESHLTSAPSEAHPLTGPTQSLPVPSNHDSNDLSIIQEDEEEPMDTREPAPDVVSEAPKIGPQDRDLSETIEARSESGRASVPPMPPKSPSEYHSAQATPVSPSFPKQTITAIDRVISEGNTADKYILPKAETPVPDRESSLPIPPSSSDADVFDMQVPLKDEESAQGAPGMSIPSLPEVAPIRKSIRSMREHGSMGTTLGTVTPGVAGKRTSWLMKAREVKALDATGKKANTVQPAPSTTLPTQNHIPSSTSKRKSGDATETLNLKDNLDAEERKAKVPRTMVNDVAPRPKAAVRPGELPDSKSKAVSASEQSSESFETHAASPSPQGVLDRLKKTVEGLGARVTKVTSKNGEDSVMANAIAEAKAAAEARIAERYNEDETRTSTVASQTQRLSSEPAVDIKMEIESEVASSSTREDKRLSISELFPSGGRVKEKHKVPSKPLPFSSSMSVPTPPAASSRYSTSTTPPHSPPPDIPSSTLVFSKPPPVFVPPAPSGGRPLPSPPAKEYAFKPTFSAQPHLGLGLTSPSSFPGFKTTARPLTTHSTMESVRSETVFDKHDDIPAWMPNTQDTEFTTYGSQSQQEQTMNICDEDDSWPVDEKLAAGVQWTYGGGMSKDDSMTWSTLPSQSQRADTGPLSKAKEAATTQDTQDLPQDVAQSQDARGIPGAFDVEMADDEYDEGPEPEPTDDDLEEIVNNKPKSGLYTEHKSFRPQSQMSMASSSSSQSQSQSQGGFLTQATKLLSNALGGTTKKKPEVKKVLQMSANAAKKKQQEEADRKAARLKEMETRRQVALQRKVEEEKAKALEEKRKLKEEMERRKREREEMSDKRPLKSAQPPKKEEEKPTKKPESEKKPSILKKTTSSTMLNKSQPKSALKPATTFSSMTTPSTSEQPAASSSGKYIGDTSKLPKATPASSLKGKSKMPPHMAEDELSQPSQMIQGKMVARVKARVEAANPESVVPSESIELPDINSEYSDSEDEDRVRTYNPPDWAQSPDLKHALELQSTINPDDIFGPVRPLRMEEMFKNTGTKNKFRARSSSANWTGTDMLTLQEEREYAKRMGFK